MKYLSYITTICFLFLCIFCAKITPMISEKTNHQGERKIFHTYNRLIQLKKNKVYTLPTELKEEIEKLEELFTSSDTTQEKNLVKIKIQIDSIMHKHMAKIEEIELYLICNTVSPDRLKRIISNYDRLIKLNQYNNLPSKLQKQIKKLIQLRKKSNLENTSDLDKIELMINRIIRKNNSIKNLETRAFDLYRRQQILGNIEKYINKINNSHKRLDFLLELGTLQKIKDQVNSLPTNNNETALLGIDQQLINILFKLEDNL